MVRLLDKKKLATVQSKIKTFERPNVKLEQYPTDSEIAADILWYACQRGDISGKIIADLGCGTGIFGIGALILGAKKVYFVDVDSDALKLAIQNVKFVENELGKRFKCEFVLRNVKDFNQRVDIVVQNPPFGVKTRHHDKLFLLKAMDLAENVYTFHKLSTAKFIDRIVEENGFEIDNILTYKLPLKKTFWFHTSFTRVVDVGCWHIIKKKSRVSAKRAVKKSKKRRKK